MAISNNLKTPTTNLAGHIWVIHPEKKAIMPYEFKANINPINKYLELDVRISFNHKDGTISEPVLCRSFIDTGATNSFISDILVPQKVKDENINNTYIAEGPTGPFNGIKIESSTMYLSKPNNSGALEVYSLPIINLHIKLGTSRTTGGEYMLIIGQDILERGKLFYDGIEKICSLTFSE